MKPQFTLLFALLLITVSVSAQKQYKLAKNSGKLNLNISGARVEGYDGNEIIFSLPENPDEEVDERAKGLKAMNSSGFKDNSGLGLDISVKGDEINVNPVSVSSQHQVTVKLPKNIKLSFRNNSNMYQDTVMIKNLRSEIDVAVTFNEIVLINNVGPMNIKTLHGSVDATFPDDLKGPISIVSVHGHVDVGVPRMVKANVDAVSNFGKIYVAEGFKIVLDPLASEIPGEIKGLTSVKVGGSAKSEKGITGKGQADASEGEGIIGNIRNADTEVVRGKINGGGFDLILKSNHNNIYIREK